MDGCSCGRAATSQVTIEKLKASFFHLRVPVLVNGSVFMNKEFEQFLRDNGVKHTISSSFPMD